MTRIPLRSPLGAPIYYVPSTSSTMDDAARLARNGAPDGLVVATDFQSAGRGRRAGRTWHAAPRESLMFTLALREPAEPATRSLVMAAAVALLLEEELGLHPAIKWPNDVLVGGRKICGILADHDGRLLTIGVGLNVAQSSFPPGLAAATSVAMERAALGLPSLPGGDGDAGSNAGPPGGHAAAGSGAAPRGSWPPLRDRLLVALLDRYVRAAPDWRALIEARLWNRGELVEVRQETGEVLVGRVIGLETDGRLIVDDGRLHRLVAGEVSLSGEGSDE